MISLLVRLVTGKSIGGFWTGAAMLVTGVALTLGSAVLSMSVGAGGSVIFYGLILGGLLRMVISAPALFSTGSTSRGTWRPTGAPGNPTGAPGPPPFVALPGQMRRGYCWMCGGKVRKGSVLCLHCGATLPSTSTAPPESEVAHAAGFDPTGSSIGIPRVAQMSAPPPPMPPGPWRSGPTPQRSGPTPQRSGPTPRRSGPTPRRSGPTPQRSGPPPQRSGPTPRRSGPTPRSFGGWSKSPGNWRG